MSRDIFCYSNRIADQDIVKASYRKYSLTYFGMAFQCGFSWHLTRDLHETLFYHAGRHSNLLYGEKSEFHGAKDSIHEIMSTILLLGAAWRARKASV